MNMVEISDLYELDLNMLGKFIIENNVKRLLLQAPDGLKPLLHELVWFMKKNFPEIKLIISGEPWYGSCMLRSDVIDTMGVDAVVHVGHNRYPWLYRDLPIPVLYMPAYYSGEPSDKLVDEIIQTINSKNIGLVASIQYIRYLSKLADHLNRRGYVVHIGEPSNPWMEKGQVLGCEYSAALNIRGKTETFIVVSGGKFHALGLSLVLRNRLVYGLDPHKECIWNASKYSEKILKIRYYKIYELLKRDIHRIALITSPTLGQYRLSLLNYLESLLDKHNTQYFVFSVSMVDKDRIASIDNAFSPDAFVITSCPRLPIDDLSDYHKPVITPGELIMVLKKEFDEYIFPW